MNGEHKWVAIAKKRIASILKTYRISYSKHLEIKISEAGPSHMRPEPFILNKALKQLEKDKAIQVLHSNPKIYGPMDFGRPGDTQRLKAFIDWWDFYQKQSQIEENCGLVLEYLVSKTVEQDSNFLILGAGPRYNDQGILHKLPGSEMLTFGNKQIYQGQTGAGLDLLMFDQEHSIPIGVECKNIREWIYPASPEVWRLIARACSIDCLPVLAARKISFITRAGIFYDMGILGFETHFQYFHNNVNSQTGYKFKERVIEKNRLGFADIKFIKKKDSPPNHFSHFFSHILRENAEEYYERFLTKKPLLEEYAINKGLADPKLPNSERFPLYGEFKMKSAILDEELYYKELEKA